MVCYTSLYIHLYIAPAYAIWSVYFAIYIHTHIYIYIAMYTECPWNDMSGRLSSAPGTYFPFIQQKITHQNTPPNDIGTMTRIM